MVEIVSCVQCGITRYQKCRSGLTGDEGLLGGLTGDDVGLIGGLLGEVTDTLGSLLGGDTSNEDPSAMG